MSWSYPETAELLVIETANREGTYEKKAEVFLKLIKEE